MQQGVVIGVFTPDEWLEAVPENFPDKEILNGKRWGFVGSEAPADILKHYMRTRLPDDMCKRGAANPVRYKI